MRRISIAPAVLLCLLLASCSRDVAAPGGQQRRDAASRGKPDDDAYRRARAMAHMYGPRPDGRRPRRPDFSLFSIDVGSTAPDRFRALLIKPSQAAINRRIGTARALMLASPRAPINQPIGAAAAPQRRARANRTTPFVPMSQSWDNLGPTNVAGRVTAIAYAPAMPHVILRGTGGGGIWRSDNDGASWTATTDAIGSLSIGAVAIAPSASSIVYAGTGEGATAIDSITGVGLILSTDGGRSWNPPRTSTETGAPIPSKFYDISIHPKRDQEALTASDLGVQRTTNRGNTWTSPVENTTVTSLARSSKNPDIVLAAAWNVAESSATGSIYRSLDGGQKWSEVGTPGTKPFSADTGRISLAFAKDSDVVYALASSSTKNALNCSREQPKLDQTGIYRSDDAGQTWVFVSNYHTGSCATLLTGPLGEQGWYANTLVVDPGNVQRLFAGGLNLWVSTNGGATWTEESDWSEKFSAPNYVHADLHALVWMGTDLLIGTDGGLHRRSPKPAFSALDTNCPTRQYYSVGLIDADRNMIIGGAQDNGLNMRNAGTKAYDEILCAGYRCGDGIDVAIHPKDASIMYGTQDMGGVFKRNQALAFDDVTPLYDAKLEDPPFMTRLAMAQDAPDILMVGTQYLHVTKDGAKNGAASWTRLSHNFGDGSETGYISAIALGNKAQIVTVGTGSGLLSRSTDGGVSWSDLKPPTGFITHIELDPADSKTFYVVYSHPDSPHVVVSTDEGQTFHTIDRGLPDVAAHVVRIDPSNRRALYAGTDAGLYLSLDMGKTWNRDATLPAVSVWDLRFANGGVTLRLATHGRGFYERK
jgi:hypothetical protein